MATDPIRLCVVGGGLWARMMHLPALASIPGVEVVSIVSRDAGAAEALAREFGVRWSTDFQAELSSPDVDVMDILAPNYLHAPMTIAAAEAGKHVICIKPMATTLAEAEAMLAATEKAGVRLFYAENVPFVPSIMEARRRVAAGAIGNVFRVKACEGIGRPHAKWHYDPALCGGGAIIDLGVHSIEFCRAVAVARVESVYAEVGTFAWPDLLSVEDTAVMTLRFANGVIGQCEDSWSLVGAPDSRFEIFGTNGRILIDNIHRHPIQMVAGGEEGLPAQWSFPWSQPGAVLDGHVDMFRHFIGCLHDGSPSASDGIDGWNVMAVVDAATRSARLGQREIVATRTATSI